MASRFPHRRNPDDDSKVSNFELFYDLVFVFAITQTTHLLIEDLTWLGALESGMILLMVWWAWQYTTWVTNELNPDAIPVRLVLVVIMLGSLLMSIAIPEAFGDKAMLFAGSYVFIQVGRHLFLTFIAADQGTLERSRAAHILNWFSVSAIFWILGALAGGDTQIILWLVALTIDSSGPIFVYYVPWLNKLDTEAWAISTDHFAERFQLFTIIALGESIVLTGATTSALEFDTPRIIAFVSAFVGSVTIWWLYFNYVSTIVQHHLSEASETIRMAKSVFVYGHFPVIAGIVLTAVGDELIIAHPTHHLETAALIAVISGPVIYLLSFGPIRFSITGTWPVRRLVGALACLAVGVIAEVTHISGMSVGLAIVAIFIAVILSERSTPVRKELVYSPESGSGSRAASAPQTS